MPHNGHIKVLCLTQLCSHCFWFQIHQIPVITTMLKLKLIYKYPNGHTHTHRVEYILTNINTFELNKLMIILKGFFVLPFNFISPHDYWHVSWCTHLDKWFWVNRCFFWNNETMSDNIMSSLEKRKYIFPHLNHI